MNSRALIRFFSESIRNKYNSQTLCQGIALQLGDHSGLVTESEFWEKQWRSRDDLIMEVHKSALGNQKSTGRKEQLSEYLHPDHEMGEWDVFEILPQVMSHRGQHPEIMSPMESSGHHHALQNMQNNIGRTWRVSQGPPHHQKCQLNSNPDAVHQKENRYMMIYKVLRNNKVLPYVCTHFHHIRATDMSTFLAPMNFYKEQNIYFFHAFINTT